MKELHRIVNEAIRTQAPGDDQAEGLTFDLSQIDLEKLRDEFAKRVRRKATALQDIRDIVEQKLAEMLARNPARMDYQVKYEAIIADYNREKDRTTIEETFRRLVELVNSLDEEQKRATKEGLGEDAAHGKGRHVRRAEEEARARCHLGEGRGARKGVFSALSEVPPSAAVPQGAAVAGSGARTRITLNSRRDARRAIDQPRYRSAGSSSPLHSQGFGPVGIRMARRERADGVRPSSAMNFAISSSCLLAIASQGEGWT